MKLFVKQYLLFFMVLLPLTGTRAQQNYSYEHYLVENGLPHNIVIQIIQDKKGFIWLASYNGISKYDGYSFKNYKPTTFDKVFMKNKRINQIVEDANGRIWIKNNSDKSNAYCFNPETETFWSTDLMVTPAAKGFHLSKIKVNKSGYVWLLSKEEGCILVSDLSFSTKVYSKKQKNLNASEVHFVFEDKKQNSWLLTNNGISLVKKNKLDKTTQYFSNQKKSFYTGVELDDEIWFGGSNGIIAKYSKVNHAFKTQKLELNANITSLEKLNEETILAITDQLGFCTINIYTGNIQIYNSRSIPQLKTANLLPITVTKNNQFWFVNANEKGIYLFDFLAQKLFYFNTNQQNTEKNTTLTRAQVVTNKKGEIWVQPNGGNFSKYDPIKHQLTPFTPPPLSRFGNFTNNFSSSFFDRQGNLWFSYQTSGLIKVVFSDNNFKTLQINSNPLQSTVKGVRCIRQTKDGNIWVSTKQKQIVVLDKNLNKIGCLSPSGQWSDNAIWNKAAYSIIEDAQSNVWIGTRGDGLYKLIPQNKSLAYKVIHFKNVPANPYSLTNDDIYSVYQDKKNQIWIGTLDGVNLVTSNASGTTRFISYRNEWKNYPIENFNKIRCIKQSREGLMYVGTTNGLLTFDPGNVTKSPSRIKSYESTTNMHQGLTSNDIIDLCITSKKEIFIATADGGINKVVKKDALGFPLSFKNYGQQNGLPSENILSLLEDVDGNIWVTSDNNLARFNPAKEFFEVYPEIKWITNGLNFSEATRFSLNSNELLFGYADGLLHFYPDQIKTNNSAPYLAFTNFKLLNQKSSENNDPNISPSIDNSNNLILKHNQNFFSIEFAALDYKNPSNVKYAYKLEGFEKNWNYIQNQRTAIYTNVPKGDYTFKVKSTNSQGIWVLNERRLPITVKPSIWNTTFFHILYAITIAAILLLINYTLNTIYRLKTNVKLEKQMSDMKQKFFVDISHEIRTPLTLITAPIEYLINDNRTPEPVKKQLSYIAQSSNRLLRLVNQVLDYRKFQDVNIKVSEINIAEFVRDIYNDFLEIAKEQGIQFTFDEEVGNTKIWADRNGLEKILMNLFSNAFKYTPKGKAIAVSITKNEKQIGIHISDEGIGISKEKLNKIFTRFVSFNDKRSNPSTGIGLSLVKELVEKHKAKLDLTSEPGKGSTFSVYFNLGKEHFSDEVDFELEEKEQDSEENREPTQKMLSKKEKGQIKILVVEDDAKLRAFIKNILEDEYQILEADNGEIGYQLTVEENPDFIVSDIMMPKMNGVDLLKKIRKNVETSHVPVILLTAKTNIESKLEGLTYGADDYITKPFSVSYFKARIENLLNQRKRLQDIFGSIDNNQIDDFNPKPHLITDQDEEIMKKVMEIIEQNIDNNKFSAESLGPLIGLNRTTFFYKIKSLTGYSPVEFIRDIRLKRAAQLIIGSQLLIKEIAYMSGFSDMKYFSKSFKNKYEVTPLEYRKQNKQ
ncbi:hybrid sensor histidine kinase/response regulator transcription factor [Flavobacterium limnophilum]|uniref:hybrid sensor histidine kinase/response regulator transcription factor n=1 Tax=Flavobacterium limnophilum TaxID=3003262 RepID=UPI0024829460|nr:two-component regulator propeller domain-containing protein [Flavobacterium limnophilum]